MTHIHPCHACPLREGCEKREEFKERARQARCTSIKFRCGILAGELRPGRRITVMVPDPATFDFDGHDDDWIEAKATITRVVSYKFNCTVDPLQHPDADDSHEQSRFHRQKPHSRIIRFLDEPDTHVCPKGCVVRDDLCDRGENFMTRDSAFDASSDDLCACKRQRWAIHHKQREAA